MLQADWIVVGGNRAVHHTFVWGAEGPPKGPRPRNNSAGKISLAASCFAARVIPSLCIRPMSVVLGRPSRAAAPSRPLTIQFVCVRTRSICAFSASASVIGGPHRCSETSERSSFARGVRVLPAEVMNARSIKFCSSLILPGQECRHNLSKRSLGM